MLRRVIIVLLVVVSSTTVFAASDAYIWPMKLRPELTSRFCDYRAGHFHAGLDVRTGGRIGVPIYAISDGYVCRTATSFTGYGKALYLKLKDDRIIVFGHLSGFFPALDERVRSVQMRDKKYNQDLYFTSAEFPIKKGQLIAYSGESGTGAPHLHFEMRSSSNNPINPLESGYNLTDKVSPEFDDLAVRYFRHSFGLGNPNEIEFLPITKTKNGYAIADTIISDGYLALAVAGGDRLDGGGFFYGYYGLKMFVDDSLVFQMESDSLSYNTTRQLNYVRDLELIRLFATKTKTDNDLGIFYRLYVPPGANQYFWDGLTDNSGVIAPARTPGQVQKVSVMAYDESGNKSYLRFYVKTPDLPAPVIDAYRHIKDSLLIDCFFSKQMLTDYIQYRNRVSQPFKYIQSDFRQSKQPILHGKPGFLWRLNSEYSEYRFCVSDLDNHYSPWTYFHLKDSDEKFKVYGSPDYLRIEFSTSYPEPTLRIFGAAEDTSLSMTPDGINQFAADLFNQKLSGNVRFVLKSRDLTLLDTSLVIYPVVPGRECELHSADSTLSISFQSKSAYYPSYVIPSNGKREQTNAGMGIVYDIRPEIMLVDAPIKFNFDVAKLGLAGKKAAVYGYSYGSGGWNFIGKIKGTTLEANGFGLGKIALLEDNDPPVISSVTPSGVSKSRTPTISCTLIDRISGLALNGGLTMTIDGVWVPAEFDIDGSRFSYKVRTPLKSGRHKFEITAVDNQGNSAVRSVDFTVSAK